MRRHCTTLVASFVAVVVCANLPARAADAGQIEIASVMGKWFEAMSLGDPKAIGSYLADDFIGVGPRGQAMRKAQYVTALANREIVVDAVRTGAQSVSHYGTFAVSSGIHRITGKFEGEDITGLYRYVDVLKKTGDGWLVVSSSLTQVKGPRETQPTTAPAR